MRGRIHGRDWVQATGGERSISASRIRRVLRRQRGFCTWCGKRITQKARRTWCGDACVTDFHLYCSVGYREFCEKRDRGVCALCGLDCEWLAGEIRKLRQRARAWISDGRIAQGDWQGPTNRRGRKNRRRCKRALAMLPRGFRYITSPLSGWLRERGFNADPGNSLWQADHIKPRVLGGNNSPENLRTLCVPCHKRETAKLARQRALERRTQQQQEEQQMQLGRKIEFTIHGEARSAGSKRPMPIRQGGLTGRIQKCVCLEMSGEKGKAWRSSVVDAARAAYQGPLLEGPLLVRFVFWRARLKGHYSDRKADRGKHVLKPDAPPFPTSQPDVLKTARAIEDALTKILYRDDVQIVDEILAKRWAAPGQPGRVDVTVQEIIIA